MNSRISPRETQLISRLILFAFVLSIALLATSRTSANAASLLKLGSFSGQQLSLHADGGFIYSLDNSGPEVTIRRMDAQTGAVQVVFTATKGSAINGGVIHELGGSSLSVRNGLIAFVTHSSWIESVVPETKDLVASVVTVRASDGVARVIASARSRYEREHIDGEPCGLSIESATVTTRQTVDVKFAKMGDPSINLRICPPTLTEESGSFVRSYGEDGSGGQIVHRELSRFWSMPDGRRFIGLRNRGLAFVDTTNKKIRRVRVAKKTQIELEDASDRLGFILRTVRLGKRQSKSQTTLYPKFGSLKNGVRLRGLVRICGSVIAQRLGNERRLNLLNRRGRVLKRLSMDIGWSFRGMYCSSSHIFAVSLKSTETQILSAKLR